MGRHPGHRDLRRPIALPRPSTCLPGEGGLFRVKAGAASSVLTATLCEEDRVSVG